MGRVPREQFVGGVIENSLVTGPACRDQLLNDVFVCVKDSSAAEELSRLQLELVRLHVVCVYHLLLFKTDTKWE